MTNTNPERLKTPDQKKRGRQRTLTPENDFFMVLARLRCGLLVEDLACRVGIHQHPMSLEFA